MHALLASIFAALFSFCHASSVQQASQTPVMYSDVQSVGFDAYIPTRQETMQMQSQQSYAENACASCLVMNASSIAR